MKKSEIIINFFSDILWVSHFESKISKVNALHNFAFMNGHTICDIISVILSNLTTAAHLSVVLSLFSQREEGENGAAEVRIERVR